jgi:hypothetical protein
MTRFEAEQRPSHAEVRDRARLLRADQGPSLAEFCAQRSWPAPKSFPGLLAGRVIQEELVDPASITGPVTTGSRTVDPDGQAVTQMTDFTEEPTDLDPAVLQRLLGDPTAIRAPPTSAHLEPAPEAPPQAAPPKRRPAPPSTGARNRGPSRVQMGLAATGILMLMALGFVGAFALGTMLLP